MFVVTSKLGQDQCVFEKKKCYTNNARSGNYRVSYHIISCQFITRQFERSKEQFNFMVAIQLHLIEWLYASCQAMLFVLHLKEENKTLDPQK